MKKIIFISTVLISFSLKAQNGFNINAAFSDFPENTKFYLENPETQTIIDSALLKSEKLHIQGRLDDTPQLLFLYTTINKEFYWCNVFIENENINISGKKEDFPFYLNKTGSKTQDVYEILNNQTKNLDKRRDELVKLSSPFVFDTSKAAQHKSDSIWSIIRPIDKATDSIRLAFIKSHLNSYAGLNELYYLKEKFKNDTLQKMYNELQPEYKSSRYGQRINNYLAVGNILKKGDNYSDFEATDTLGNKHKLSDFIGKYVLLDFTETYCGPCVLSADELKKEDSIYKNKLQIISFCADKSKDVWLKGITRDKPTWTSLWDGESLYGKTILKYGVTGYPTFFLLNPQGKIIWKNSGYGKGTIEDALLKNIQ